MCSASTAPFVCGRPARMKVWRAPSELERLAKGLRAVLAAVVGEHALQPPARGLQLGRDAAGELGGLLAGRVAARAADELGPGIRGVDVDRGQLPDGALRPGEPADEEGVHAHELAWTLGLDVALGLGLARRLVGSGVAGDEG